MVSHARQWAMAALPPSWPLVDEVALVVSELVTNAIRYSASGDPDGHVLLEVRCGEEGWVELSVTDQGSGSGASARYVPTDVEEGGRGIALVHDLVDAYDVTYTSGGSRCVWCRFDRPVSDRHQ
ncbi:ATP-binding protein [Microbispora sp. NBRC 16548]|uniref:ATP-binding protein n=1 Tax=Microbispora sp. NBRC 16548 TaxID=3030994 RepID=UPI003324B206